MMVFLDKFFAKLKSTPKLYVGYDDGKKNLPTIVLLHGISARWEFWNEIIGKLKEDKCRVIAVDLLGFGRSPHPKDCDYTVEDHTKALHKTLKSLSIKKPFLIIGHSMGSIISARYVNKYDKDIKAAILCSLPLYEDSKRKSLVNLGNDTYKKFYNFLINNQAFAIKYSKHARKLFNIQNSLEINEENWDSFRLSLKNTIIEQKTYEDIRHSKVPIDILYGAGDQLLITSHLDRLSDFSNVRVERIVNADHSINAKYAQAILGHIKQFMSSI